MEKILVHSFSFHHDKYMREIRNMIVGSVLIKDKNKEKVNDHDFSIGVTNSYLGFNTTRKIKEKSKEKKLISLCHTTFGWSENIYMSQSNEDGFIFAVPKFWQAEENKRMISYHGHYMMLHHYNTPPSISPTDGVLYMPPSGIKDINEVKEIIKNIKQKVYIKPHPISELNSFPANWSESAKGLLLKDYKELESSKVQVLTSKDVSLSGAIDAFDFIIGTPPTSALIEACARGKIYRQNKRIVYTDNMEGIPEKYGINFSSSPCMKDFGIIEKQVLDEIVIGKTRQENEIKRILGVSDAKRKIRR